MPVKYPFGVAILPGERLPPPTLIPPSLSRMYCGPAPALAKDSAWKHQILKRFIRERFLSTLRARAQLIPYTCGRCESANMDYNTGTVST